MSRDASLRQRGNRTYSFAQHGGSSQGQRRGKHIIRNNQAIHWTPKWGEGYTTFRILPARNPEDPTQWDAFRYSSENDDYGDWLRRYPAVRSFGDPGMTFVLKHPADDSLAEETLPPCILYNAIAQAVGNGSDRPGWAALLGHGQGNQRKVLPRPSEVFLVQGLVMQHGNEVYSPPRGFSNEDRVVMLELSSNAGVVFLQELAKVAENSGAAEGDWQNYYVHGDPVSLDHGGFVTWYKLADGDPRARQQQQSAGWNTQSSGQGNQRGGNQAIGYGCFIEDTFNGLPPQLTQFEPQIANKVVPWDDLVHIPTPAEQAAMIAHSFPPDVIAYAWQSRPEWIPEDVRNAAVGHVQVNPPNSPGGWNNQQQAQGGWGGNQTPPAQTQQPGWNEGQQQTPPGNFNQPLVPPAAPTVPTPPTAPTAPPSPPAQPGWGGQGSVASGVPAHNPFDNVPPAGPTGTTGQPGVPPASFGQPQAPVEVPTAPPAAPPTAPSVPPAAEPVLDAQANWMTQPNPMASQPQEEAQQPPSTGAPGQAQQVPPTGAPQVLPASDPPGQPTAMGQTPGGFAPPPAGMPQPDVPPPAPAPANGQQPNRSNAALAAAQAAAQAPTQ